MPLNVATSTGAIFRGVTMTKFLKHFVSIPCVLLAACTTQPDVEAPVLDGIPPAWTQVKQVGTVAVTWEFETNNWITIDEGQDTVAISAFIHDLPDGPRIFIDGTTFEDLRTGKNFTFHLEAALADLADTRPLLNEMSLAEANLTLTDDGNAQFQTWQLTRPTDSNPDTGHLIAEFSGTLCNYAIQPAPGCAFYHAVINTVIDFREY